MFKKFEKEMKSDLRAANQIWLPWWAVLSLIIVGVPIAWLVDRFGKLNLFLPAFNSIGALAFVTAIKWTLRRHAWFWGIMAMFAVVHLLLVLLVPWPTKWIPALAIAAIGSGDVIVMFAILNVVERFMEDPTTAARDSDQ